MISRNELLSKAIKAIEEHNASLVDYLKQGFDANSTYKDKPLLYWAVKQESYDGFRSTSESRVAEADAITNNIKVLYEHGADIHWRDENDDTLLHLTEEYKAVKLLLSFGLNAGLLNKAGRPAHRNDRYDGRGRVLAFFEAGVDLSYLGLSDNPSLNHPEIMRYVLSLANKQVNGISVVHGINDLERALDRSLGLPRWLPAAKVLIEAGASLSAKIDKNILPLHLCLCRCINNIKIYGDWKDMADHKENNFVKLDGMIRDNSYFQFAEYLYEMGAFSKCKDDLYAVDTLMPPLVRVQKDTQYLPSKRVIDHLAHYEAKALGVDVDNYKNALNKIINTACEAQPVRDYVGEPRGTVIVGFVSHYNYKLIRQIWDEYLKPVKENVSVTTNSLFSFAKEVGELIEVSTQLIKTAKRYE